MGNEDLLPSQRRGGSNRRRGGQRANARRKTVGEAPRVRLQVNAQFEQDIGQVDTVSNGRRRSNSGAGGVRPGGVQSNDDDLGDIRSEVGVIVCLFIVLVLQQSRTHALLRDPPRHASQVRSKAFNGLLCANVQLNVRRTLTFLSPRLISVVKRQLSRLPIGRLKGVEATSERSPLRVHRAWVFTGVQFFSFGPYACFLYVTFARGPIFVVIVIILLVQGVPSTFGEVLRGGCLRG